MSNVIFLYGKSLEEYNFIIDVIILEQVNYQKNKNIKKNKIIIFLYFIQINYVAPKMLSLKINHAIRDTP